MLILPPGHAQQIHVPRRLSRRERGLLGASLATVAVLIAVVVVALASGGASSSNGCVHVNLPYSTGGASLNQCGTGARALCAEVGRPGALTGAAAAALAQQCRRAGVPLAELSRARA